VFKLVEEVVGIVGIFVENQNFIFIMEGSISMWKGLLLEL
jgi:hypothetical protein